MEHDLHGFNRGAHPIRRLHHRGGSPDQDGPFCTPVPLQGTPSATETASAFIKKIVRLHGVPDSIISDRGVQFTSRFWRALCQALNIELRLSTAYHPQTNGQTERTNQTLEQYLRCFSSFAQDDWLLPLAEFSYNNSIHSATKQSPFFANYGYHPSYLLELSIE